MTMGDQIPVIVEKPIGDCGYRKFQVDSMGDHLCNCTVHSGVKKTHDWEVEQLTDFFRTTHHTKTQHVTKNRGRHCGHIQLEAYLVNTVGPVSLVMDLHIDHDRFGSSSDPSLNGHLHYPNDIDKSYMRLMLKKYGNIVLTITIIPLAQSPLCLLLVSGVQITKNGQSHIVPFGSTTSSIRTGPEIDQKIDHFKTNKFQKTHNFKTNNQGCRTTRVVV
jgi:hypothetical protein